MQNECKVIKKHLGEVGPRWGSFWTTCYSFWAGSGVTKCEKNRKVPKITKMIHKHPLGMGESESSAA